MNPSQIIFLVNDIHFNGGGERVTANMANWFVVKGYDVTILSMSCRLENKTFPINKNVKISYLNVVNSRLISKFIVGYRLWKFIKKMPPDTLFFGIGTYANTLLGLFKSSQFYAIGCEHNAFNSVSLIWKILRKLTYFKLNSCTVLTSSDINYIKKLNSKSCVIPNSTPFVKETSSLLENKFIAIGRLSHQKSFDKMIRIFKEFSLNFNEWKLEIYGDGDEKSKLENLITNLNLKDKVSLNKFSDNIRDVYLNASALLLTSIYEGLPMVLLEAQSYGLPIISYDCDTGPRDVVINGKNGFLIDMDNTSEFIHAMSIIATNINLRKQLGQNAKLDSIRFSEDVIYDQWIKLINSI